MSRQRKTLRGAIRGVGQSGLLLALALPMLAGCSGINASKSVSPLDFIIPGLIQNGPPQPALPSGTDARICSQAVNEPDTPIPCIRLPRDEEASATAKRSI